MGFPTVRTVGAGFIKMHNDLTHVANCQNTTQHYRKTEFIPLSFWRNFPNE